MNAAAQQLEECIQQLKRGELTEERLRDLGKTLQGNRSGRQSLLYLQTATTAVTSDVIGMLQVADGEVSDGPFDPADWPYKTVLDAINAGWRVIRFPAQLLSSHSPDLHVTCEFILEKWE
ncbi:MAG: hypothetical protein OXH93_02705 [Caldilineaceae bacterium]|nr:hypothetical protein [Caldilineaceae bacterium]